jgi:hypothetical protein
MSATVTTTPAEHFKLLCGALETRGYELRLLYAALEALGSDWYVQISPIDDRRVIEHRGSRVRVTLDEGVFTVHEFDLFGFELAHVTFAQHRTADRARVAPRALAYATALAEELEA